MKVERTKPKPKFVPVIVTLESQAEVDAIFVLLDHTKIVQTFPVLVDCYAKFKNVRSDNYDDLFAALEKLLGY